MLCLKFKTPRNIETEHLGAMIEKKAETGCSACIWITAPNALPYIPLQFTTVLC